jgi:hypothetical protein
MTARMLYTRMSRTAALAVSLALVTSVATTGTWHRSEDVTSAVAAVEPSASDGVAQTEREARAEAATSGQPVEVLAFRSERRDVLANPDGTVTVRQYAAPVRTMKDGAWVDLDPTLEIREDGRIAPVATTVDVTFSGGGDGPLAQVRRNGRGVSLGWEGRCPRRSWRERPRPTRRYCQGSTCR